MAKYVKGSNVGSSTLTATYSGKSASISITVNKGAGSVTAPIAATGLTYGSTSNLLSNGGSGTGTMMYRVGTSGNFSSTIPTASGRNVGTYTVYYYAAASTNYTQSATGSVDVTIGKADQPITVSMLSTTGTQTIYDRSGYNLIAFSVSGNQGTVGCTIISGNNYITTSTSGNNVTVTYKSPSGNSAAQIVITAAETTNYKAAGKNYNITTKVDTLTSTQLQSTTYGTPSSVTIGSGLTAAGGSATCSCTCTNTKYYKDYYESGYVSEQYSTPTTGYVNWSIVSQNCAGGTNRFSISGSTLSHTTMGTNTTYDKVTVRATNNGDSTKYTNSSELSISNVVTNSNYDPSEYTASISIGSGLTAGEGEATVTASASHKARNYYTSGSYDSSKHTVTDSVSWSITTQTFTPSGGSASTITRFSKSSNKLSHTSMTSNVGTDYVKVTATNGSSSSATATAEKSISNSLTWGNVSLTVSSPATPCSMSVSGETKTISASATQSGTYTSGSTTSATPTISYAVKTAATGYSLSSNKVTVTNNTSTSARNGFVVTVTASGSGSKTATSDRTFNQAAGSKSYGTPSITAYTYASFAASGDTKSPASVTYTQTWTWNGVSGSGGTITSGGTLAYSTTGTLPSGFSTASDFATSGKVTWDNRTTTVDDARSAKSNLLVKVTLNGVTSGNYTCTSCDQVANSLGTQKYKNTSGTTGYNVVYVAPQTCTISSSLTAAGGTFYVTCAVTNNTNWYQKYTSGSYTSLQSGTEGGTAKWQITSNGNSRFSNPSSGGATVGSYTLYPSGSSYTGSHSNMTTNATTDTVTVTAYNVGDTSKTKTASASVTNSLVSISATVGTNPISYLGKTSITVTAKYTSNSTKDVSSSATYSDTGSLIEFNKTENI